MSSTKNYFGSRKGAVGYVKDKQTLLNPGFASIMIIGRDSLEGYSAHTVIDASWADIERLMGRAFSKAQPITSEDLTQSGLSLNVLNEERKDDAVPL